MGSGESVGGVGWGIVVPKSSERRSVEKVRLASSAGVKVSKLKSHIVQLSIRLTLLEVQLTMRCPLFGF